MYSKVLHFGESFLRHKVYMLCYKHDLLYSYGHTLIPPGIYRRSGHCKYKAGYKGSSALRLCTTWWDAQVGGKANVSLICFYTIDSILEHLDQSQPEEWCCWGHFERTCISNCRTWRCCFMFGCPKQTLRTNVLFQTRFGLFKYHARSW